jgi:hypothetical protein
MTRPHALRDENADFHVGPVNVRSDAWPIDLWDHVPQAGTSNSECGIEVPTVLTDLTIDPPKEGRRDSAVGASLNGAKSQRS